MTRERVGPIGGLLAAAFAARLAHNLLQVTYPVLGGRTLRLAPTSIGAAVSLAGVVTVGGTLSLGFFGRTRHASVLATCGLAALSASCVAFGLANGFGMYVLGALLTAAGATLVFPSLVSLVVFSSPHSRSRALSRYTAALSSALLVGPLVQSAVLVGLGGSLRAASLALAFWFVVGAGCVGFARKRRNRDLLDAEEPQAPRPRRQVRAVLRSIAHNNELRLALWHQSAFEAVFVTVVSFGAVAAEREDHLSFQAVLWLFGALYAVSLGIRSTFSVRFPISWRPHLAQAGVVMDVACVALLAIGSRATFVIAMVLVGVAHGVSYPITLSLLAEGTDTDAMLSRNSLLAAVLGVVSTIVPAIIGATAASAGYPVAFGVVGAVVIALGALTWRSSLRAMEVPTQPPG